MLGRVTSPAASAASIPGQPDLPPTPEGGLDDAEVARRRAAGLGNAPPPPTSRTYAQILRENVFTFINNILFALGVALVAVGRPIDALVSRVGDRAPTSIVGVVQEIRAKRTLDRIALLTRPTATRDPRRQDARGRAGRSSSSATSSRSRRATRSCSTGALVAGPVRLDESQLTGESDVVRKKPGDEVFSGSFATTGDAAATSSRRSRGRASRTRSPPARAPSAACSRRSRARSTS